MKRKWESFVVQEELNEVAVIAVRISDNILDEEDWPVHVLKFREGGICTQQTVENKGAYAMNNFVDKDLNELVEWSNCDLTGSYGELSHDLCVLIYF